MGLCIRFSIKRERACDPKCMLTPTFEFCRLTTRSRHTRLPPVSTNRHRLPLKYFALRVRTLHSLLPDRAALDTCAQGPLQGDEPHDAHVVCLAGGYITLQVIRSNTDRATDIQFLPERNLVEPQCSHEGGICGHCSSNAACNSPRSRIPRMSLVRARCSARTSNLT